MAIGIGLLLPYKGKYKGLIFGLPIFALLWAIADHILVNYLSALNDSLFFPLKLVFYCDRSGLGIVWFMMILLALSIIIEENIFKRNIAGENDIYLPGETGGPSVFSEMKFAVERRFNAGLLKIFSLRRQYAYKKHHSVQDEIATPIQQQELAALKADIKNRINTLNAVSKSVFTLNFEKIVSLVMLAWGLVIIFILPLYWCKTDTLFQKVVNYGSIISIAWALWTFWKNRKLFFKDGAAYDANSSFGLFCLKALSATGLGLSVLSGLAYFLPVANILYKDGYYISFLWQAFGGFFNAFGKFIPGLAGACAGMAGAIGGLLGGGGEGEEGNDGIIGAGFSAVDGGVEGAGKYFKDIGEKAASASLGKTGGIIGVIGTIFDTGGAGEITGSTLGGSLGLDLGAEYGAALGTAILPGVGTVIGAVAGGAIGAMVGSSCGGRIGSLFDPPDIDNYVDIGGEKYGR